MNHNLEKKTLYHESPHIVIHKSLHLISENSIFLTNPVLSDDHTFLQTIHYNIEKIGSNVKIHSKNVKYKNVRIDDMKRKKLFILVQVKNIKHVHSLIFFDEFGRRMNGDMLEQQEKAYVLLAMISVNEITSEKELLIDNSDVTLATKSWVNQIKSDKSFHFNTTGRIFGLGFGPKYSINAETNLSVGPFASKKKTVSKQLESEQEVLKKKIFKFSRLSIEKIFSTFGVIRGNISPNISKLQIHFDLFGKEKKDEYSLQKYGILNAHLCLNAQTRVKHTECDSSYTIISVPPQEKEKTVKGRYNNAEFEFNISDEETLVIPLQVGTMLVYSGYMLTHRQQIKKLNEDVKPFINVVSYNSQKMFSHLMESFCREIKMDSRRK